MSYHLLFVVFFCIFLEGFFSMFEMASVSFNVVRLQYYVAKKNKRGIWLNHLLKRPTRLFGTTLIMVNASLLLASEALRRFYEGVGISPDFAPFSILVIAVIFAELSPLFAARRHPESVAFFSVGVVYFTSKLLSPIIWFIDLISRGINRLFGREGKDPFITKEEIKKAFEGDRGEVDYTIGQLLSMGGIKACDIMHPVESVNMLAYNISLGEIKDQGDNYFLIYHKNMHNIVAVATYVDILKGGPEDRVVDFGRSPWFVAEESSLLNILKEFRHNKQMVAIVLDKDGKASGVLTLDDIACQIFASGAKKFKRIVHFFVEKTLRGSMKLSEFNKRFGSSLEYDDCDTISDMVKKELGHLPCVGDRVHVDNFEFVVKEQTLFGTKKILVRTI